MNLFTLLSSLLISTTVLADETAPSLVPRVSANALFLFQDSNFHKEDEDPALANFDKEPNGFNVREIEVQFLSDVDAFTRLNVVLALHPELESDGTTVEETWNIEPEIAYGESSAISGVTLRVGKFKAAMGKHNLLHTHAFPFIQAPLANQYLLGDEGLNDAGVSAAVNVPAAWKNEITFQYLRGDGENEEFKSPSPGDGVGLVNWNNSFQLSEKLAFQASASYAAGNNTFKEETQLTSADLALEWSPEQNSHHNSVLWAFEYLQRMQAQDAVADEKSSGIATWVQYYFADHWAGLYRFDNLEVKNSFDPVDLPDDIWERNSLALIYLPSETSSFKFEYNERTGGAKSVNNDSTEKVFYFQANFTIGGHSGHSH